MRTFQKQTCILLSFFLCLFCLFISACQKGVDYFSYVSELRSNIFLAENEEYSLRIYAVKRESPYEADGIPKEVFSRTEIYLRAPTNETHYSVSFDLDGKTYGGELSYDNVKGEYYLYCPVDVSSQAFLTCTVSCKDTELSMQALSVLEKDCLVAQNVLQCLIKAEPELFANMTDKYGFCGEIYLRLIYEDAPYYYIGIIDRNKTVHAFLMHAKTGKILAKRQS